MVVMVAMLPRDLFPFVKVSVSNHVIEVWRYAEMPVQGKPDDGMSVPERTVEDTLHDRVKNQRRSKWQFMRTVNCTFSEGSKFITFTFADGVLKDVTDVREANSYWHKFIHRMQRKYGHFEWAVVVEFQDKNGRGAVHYHMIANLPYIPKEQLDELWRGGFVWIEKIDHVDNVGAYVVKYMAVDMDDVRLCGLKAWRTSRNVKKPLVLRGDDARDFLSANGVEDYKVALVTNYVSEYHGTIQYEQYNLMRTDDVKVD
jgi:hypothetical protein